MTAFCIYFCCGEMQVQSAQPSLLHVMVLVLWVCVNRRKLCCGCICWHLGDQDHSFIHPSSNHHSPQATHFIIQLSYVLSYTHLFIYYPLIHSSKQILMCKATPYLFFNMSIHPSVRSTLIYQFIL